MVRYLGLALIVSLGIVAGCDTKGSSRMGEGSKPIGGPGANPPTAPNIDKPGK